MKGLIVAIAIGGITLGCADSDRLPSKRVVIPAPAATSETGVLLGGASLGEIRALLDLYPQAKARPLHKEQGLYEIHGLSLSQIRQATPAKIRLSENKYFRTGSTQSQPTTKPSDPFDQFTASCAQTTAADSNIQITMNADKDIFRSNYYVLKNQKLKITASGLDSLKYAWLITTPKNSMLPKAGQLGSEINLTPDHVGVYNAFVVGKNADGKCLHKSQQIFVSANPKYDAHQKMTDNEKSNFSLLPFWHLDVIGAKDPKQNNYGEGVVIAVIDTGLDYNHSLVSENVLVNTNEIPDNGIDDDNNGYVDDYVGYDFANQDSNPYDDDGHGTHVTGLAASFIGAAPGAKVLAVKAFNPLGMDIGTVTAAIYYSVDRGANIINASFGWEGDFPEFKQAIEYANQHGVYVVTAAGNGDQTGFGVDNDLRPSYPTNYEFNNIISVTAVDESDRIPAYANYGLNSVDLAALGGTNQLPLSSLAISNPKGETLEQRYGTSMATALTTGALALILSNNIHSPKEFLLKNVKPDDDLREYVSSSGILDLTGLYSHDLRLANQ